MATTNEYRHFGKSLCQAIRGLSRGCLAGSGGVIGGDVRLNALRLDSNMRWSPVRTGDVSLVHVPGCTLDNVWMLARYIMRLRKVIL